MLSKRAISRALTTRKTKRAPQEENILKAIVVGDANSVESKQITEEERAWNEVGLDVIRPPVSPAVWAAAMERSTRLSTSIRKYARNTVGLGWEVVPTPEVQTVLDAKDADLDAAGKELKNGLPAAVAAETLKVRQLLDRPNQKMTFTRILELWKIDEEATGNGMFECVRNLKGDISALYHVHSANIRVLKGGKGYVQLVGGERRFFKMFGDQRVIDNRTGKVFEPTDDQKILPLQNRASELVHTMIYSPRSPFYGVPRYVSTAPAIAGSRMAAERNAFFFENDCVPRVAVVVNGGRLDADSVEMLKKFFEKGKGPENAHRAVILQAQKKQSGLAKQEDVEVKVEPLTLGINEDASFQQYRGNNDEEIREAFGIDRSFFTTEGVNKASAIIGRAITIEQEFMPDIIEKEFLLNSTIIVGLGVTKVCIRLRRPRVSSEDSDARTFNMLMDGGGITPNDIRALLKRNGYEGFDPISEEWADKPIVLSNGAALAETIPPAKPAAETSQKAAMDLVRSLSAFTQVVDRQLAERNGRVEARQP